MSSSYSCVSEWMLTDSSFNSAANRDAFTGINASCLISSYLSSSLLHSFSLYSLTICFSKYRSLFSGENPDTWKHLLILNSCFDEISVHAPGRVVSIILDFVNVLRVNILWRIVFLNETAFVNSSKPSITSISPCPSTSTRYFANFFDQLGPNGNPMHNHS